MAAGKGYGTVRFSRAQFGDLTTAAVLGMRYVLPAQSLMETAIKAYLIVLPLVIAVFSSASAQQIPRQAYEDSVVGWMKVYKFTGARAPMTVDAKRYSPAQLSIADSLANWIQASYLPKGALGDVRRNVSEKLGLYNRNDAALPQTYGAYAKTYTELKYDANRKMVPFTNSHLIWSIQANLVFGEPLDAINTPTQYYFILPGLGRPPSAEGSTSHRYDLSGHPAVKKYITYFNDQLNSSTANATYVLLSKDNKLPFVTVSRAEYLDKLTDAVVRRHESEKAEAIKQWPDGNARASALAAADARHQTRMSVLASNRQKYASQLQETAEVFSLQPSVLLENQPDLFERRGSAEKYAVYKIDPVLNALAKSDKPQWVVVWWNGDLLDPVGKQQIDAIVGNFDFQYLYDFFFAPENVKGRTYKPLRSPAAVLAAKAPVREPSAAARSAATEAGVFFFEDFSTNDIGRTPHGWTVGRTTGTIVNLDGLRGNWALMAGDADLSPKQLKALPRDFTLTYELVASQNFRWGAKGMTLLLANERSPGNADAFIRLKLRPGFDGRDGEAELETKFGAGYQSGTKWYPATGFSNNEKNNRVTVSIRKSGESVQVFLDSNKIAEYEKAMPAAQAFNKMLFSVMASPSELADKFYLSQIKISK